MRLVLRLIGLAFLVAAVAVVARDVVSGAGPFDTDAGALWYRIHPYSLGLAQVVVQRYLLPEIWDPGIVTILLWPAALVLAVPGLLLLVATLTSGRRDRRRAMR